MRTISEKNKGTLAEYEQAIDWLKRENFEAICKCKYYFYKLVNSTPDYLGRMFILSDFIKFIEYNYTRTSGLLKSAMEKDPQNLMAFLIRGIIQLMVSSGGKEISYAMVKINAALVSDRSDPLAYYARAKAW